MRTFEVGALPIELPRHKTGIIRFELLFHESKSCVLTLTPYPQKTTMGFEPINHGVADRWFNQFAYVVI